MSRPPTHNHVAFVACTGIAIAIIVGMWIWNVRAIVADGVAGSREMVSDVAETAGAVKQRSSPDPETVESIKAGFKTIIRAPAEQEEQKQETISAVAEIMSGKLDSDGAVEETSVSEVDPLDSHATP